MITSLSINHFKSLERVDIDFSNTTIFVGNNASGKSNIVDAIRFVRDAMINGLDRAIGDRHGIQSIRQWSPTRPYRISFTINVSGGDELSAKYHFAIDSARSEWKVVREEAEIYNKENDFFEVEDEDEGAQYIEGARHRKVVVSRDDKGLCDFAMWTIIRDKDVHIDKNLFFRSPGLYDNEPQKRSFRVAQSDELLLNLRAVWEIGPLRSQLANFQAYNIFPNTLRLPQEPSNETYLSPEGRNLASVFKRMRRSSRGVDALNQITAAMTAIMPTLDRISVLTVGGYLVIQFHVIEPTGRGHTYNVSQLSDGTLRMLGLLTALYQEPKPAIIALEEPEQTVNPGILTVLADSIKEVAKRSQILITTHSPNLLDKFAPEFIETVEMVGGKTQVAKIGANQMEAVKERLFTLGELLSAEGLHP